MFYELWNYHEGGFLFLKNLFGDLCAPGGFDFRPGTPYVVR